MGGAVARPSSHPDRFPRSTPLSSRFSLSAELDRERCTAGGTKVLSDFIGQQLEPSTCPAQRGGSELRTGSAAPPLLHPRGRPLTAVGPVPRGPCAPLPARRADPRPPWGSRGPRCARGSTVGRRRSPRPGRPPASAAGRQGRGEVELVVTEPELRQLLRPAQAKLQPQPTEHLLVHRVQSMMPGPAAVHSEDQFLKLLFILVPFSVTLFLKFSLIFPSLTHRTKWARRSSNSLLI